MGPHSSHLTHYFRGGQVGLWSRFGRATWSVSVGLFTLLCLDFLDFVLSLL